MIESIDTSEALKLPGVKAVLTRDDVRDMDPYFGAMVRDRPLVATEKVRYEGEPVAAVAASDALTAERALELIRVEYRALPVVDNVVDALSASSDFVHDSNLCHRENAVWGDADEGFARADHIFEDTFTFPMVYHYALEPHTVIADYSPSQRHHGVVHGPTPLPSTRRPLPHVRLPAAPSTHHRPLLGRRFRQQVLLQVGASDSCFEQGGWRAGAGGTFSGRRFQDHPAPRR